MNYSIVTSRAISAVIAVFMMMFPFVSTAQNAEKETTNNIVEEIEEESNGNIDITIPDNLLKLVLPETSVDNYGETSTTKKSRHLAKPRQTSGFRVQIFSDGRNQRTSRALAQARSNTVLARFPKYRNQIYSFSKAPNWYTRVGNFKTQREANAALSELRRAFPGFAGEMRVVRSNIVIVN